MRKTTESDDIIYRAFKFRLYPTKEQAVQFAKTFGCVRKVYNLGIEMQRGLYEAGFKVMSATDLNNYCNRSWKVDFPFLADLLQAATWIIRPF